MGSCGEWQPGRSDGSRGEAPTAEVWKADVSTARGEWLPGAALPGEAAGRGLEAAEEAVRGLLSERGLTAEAAVVAGAAAGASAS